MSRWMVGIDIGGTFTDVAAMEVETGRSRITKTPSTPADPSMAVRAGLENLLSMEAGMAPEDIRFFAHGTTVATNTVIELKGACVGLLLTAGTEAVYELRGGTRPVGADLIDPMYQKPSALVPRRLTIGIRERCSYEGQVIDALDEAEVRSAVRRLCKGGVTSIAVCYLFSYVNPVHEQRTREIIAEEAPECRVSLSSEVLPVVREYRRVSTTVLDAYVGQVVERYLDRLGDRLADAGLTTEQLFIMQSNGGLMRLNIAASYPSQTVLSGPAAGVVFGEYLGRITGHPDIVTFDIGGTSTDISLVSAGEHEETRSGEVSGQDLGLPMIQIRTFGAGGGTVAWVGPDGLLKVGPRSAGAVPGPACYGNGGTEPTVTDANLVLGYLDPDGFVGGGVRIDPELARRAIQTHIAGPLGLTVEEAALGIIRVMNVNLEVGLRLSFVERGLDQRTFVLAAFGGAGPVHAAQVARDLSMNTVIVPPNPGIGCAMGLLQSDVKHHYLRTKFSPLELASASEIESMFEDLEARAISDVLEEGFDRADVMVQRQLDLRYPYQGYELTVSCDGSFTEESKPDIRRAFHARHEEVYRTSAKDQDPDVVNVRVVCSACSPRLTLAKAGRGGLSPEAAMAGTRPALFDANNGYVDVPIYDRARLLAGNRIEGPGIVKQFDSTVLILAGQAAVVDDVGNLVISTGVAGGTVVPSAERRRRVSPTEDPVSLAIIHNRLLEITGTMEHVLFHSGYSTILRESHDGSAGLCMVDAQTVITVGTVNHLYPYHKSTLALLDTYGVGDLEDGDAFIVTDPYEAGSSHLPDLVAVTPVFVEGELFAFSVSTAHKPDLGGLVPGSSSPAAREIYHEGLLVPMVRYWTKRGVVREVEAIIGRNSRVPETVIGDLRAQVGCNRIGGDRLVALCEEYGKDAIRTVMSEILRRTEMRLRDGLSLWPDGESEAESFIDDDGVDLDKPIRLHVKVVKQGNRISIDYSGTNEQVKGPINLGPAVSQAAGLLALLTHIDPTIPINDGARRVINFINPEGLLTHPRWPAPVNSYFGTMSVLADTVGRALARFDESRAVGSLGYGLGAVAIGHKQPRNGKSAVQYELFISSRGGTPTHDGVKGVNGVVNHVPYTPIEILESEFPVRVLRYDWTQDTAGAGEHRGGPGLCKEYEMLDDATVTLRLGHQFQHGGWGVYGGKAPAMAKAMLTWAAGDKRALRPLETVSLAAGDRLRIELPGGGGYGDPLARDPDRVLEDVLDGYVSAEAAASDYGVVVNTGDLVVDSAQTAQLRAARLNKASGEEARGVTDGE